MTDDLPDDLPQYNQHLMGFKGQFGTGGNVKVLYLQTALDVKDLDKVSLISEIPGAESWSIRDIFQREVDSKRVGDSLIPYFKNPEQAKFFNPLTLTLLPIKETKIENQIPCIEPVENQEGNHRYQNYTFDGFRLKWILGRPYYGSIDWDDKSVKVVAIDGQHRLSALKRFKQDLETHGNNECSFSDWTIPVVIFLLVRDSEEKSAGRLIDVVRNVFTYINSTAQKPNEVRSILLSNDSPNKLATQELLQYCHERDVEDASSSKIPLLAFEWRGMEIDKKLSASDLAITSSKELYEWISNYLLLDDFSEQQQKSLMIDQTKEAVFTSFKRKVIQLSELENFRSFLREDFVVGFVDFLSALSPFKNYISALKEEIVKAENQAGDNADTGRHAVYFLKYGVNKGISGKMPDVEKQAKEVCDTLRKIKESHFSGLLGNAIGLRALISCYGKAKAYIDKDKQKIHTWTEYSSIISDAINEVIHDGWFDSRKITERIHISETPDGSIVNYKIEQIPEALGALTLLLALRNLKRRNCISENALKDVWDEASICLQKTMVAGFRKEARAKLRPDYPQGGRDLSNAARKQAEVDAETKINSLEEIIFA